MRDPGKPVRAPGLYLYRGPDSGMEWTAAKLEEDGTVWIIGSDEAVWPEGHGVEWGPQVFPPRDIAQEEADDAYQHHSPRYHANVLIGSLMHRQQGLLTD